MKKVNTISVKIYVGLREGYTDRLHQIDEVYDLCQDYVDVVGLCVTVNPIRFIYKNGHEDGAEIGLINYPRFPSTKKEIKKHALGIAKLAMGRFNQNRISIVVGSKTIMIERGNK